MSTAETFVLSEIRDAVNAACECGGGPPGECCAACNVWHWLHGSPLKHTGNEHEEWLARQAAREQRP